ncbi:MAG: cation transporter [Chloroflexi bacterium]|nr:cation transporter [Chloroflexota bacterium]
MHNHNHAAGTSHLAAAGTRPLKMALFIITGIMVAEVIGGIVSNSLALLGDAGHMFVDALALALSLAAMTMAQKPASRTRTFGYHRMEILAALANGITIALVSVYIFYEAYHRLLEPPEVKAPMMITVAVVGLVGNLAAVFLLQRGSLVSLNMRSALWHVIGDTVSSVGVIGAAIIIALTGWTLADPVIAVAIGAIILIGAVRLIRESVHILAEAVPKNVDVDKVVQVIKNTGGVDDVHDIHIWTITSGIHAMSAHLVIADQRVSQCSDVIDSINHNLSEQFQISHTALQLECETCPSGFVCEIEKPKNNHNHNGDAPLPRSRSIAEH